MAAENSFADLMGRLREGDEQAAKQVYERFARRLIGLARRRIDSQLRQKVDPEDVTQSAYKSFFRRQARGEFELRDWDSLWGLLAAITLHKCGHRIDYYRAARRDVHREATPLPRAENSNQSWEAIAREPTPSEAAVLAETVEELMRGLEGYQRQIVQLRLQDYTVAEISVKVGYTERTVHRILKQVRKRLENLRARNDISRGSRE
jgi:RNA polymerase sigma-70 factor (ECF subfamily)